MGSVLSWVRVGGLVVFSLIVTTQFGCQVQQSFSAARIIKQQPILNTTGLKAIQTYDIVKANIAPPKFWDQLNVKKTALFTDIQWRSPSKHTGVGVAYIKMPLPLPPATLIWFAKQEYCKRGEGGQLLGEWTDDLGRPWFEAENKKYHVRGYVVTKGFEAWIVYSGYRMEDAPSEEELTIAKRAQEMIIPTPFAPNKAQLPTATAE